jgi:hypothetical protein
VKLFEHPDFGQAILQAAEHFHAEGWRPAIVEKDYFVTETLPSNRTTTESAGPTFQGVPMALRAAKVDEDALVARAFSRPCRHSWRHVLDRVFKGAIPTPTG